jgi:hypothetical protein
MTVVVRPDILSCLQSVREDVQRKVAMLDRYRALKAIEQTIADFPDLDDVTRPLSDIRHRVQQQLDETREFRALRSIERIMPELCDVLALIDDGAARDHERTDVEPDVTAGTGSAAVEPDFDGSQDSPAAPGLEAVSIETAVSWEADEDRMIVPTATPVAAGGEGPSGAGAKQEIEPDQRAPKADAMPPGPEAETVPSLADSVAQLMAQSMSPPREAHAPPAAHPPERSDAALPHAERAA